MASIRALRPEDDRSRFSSGQEDLDRFFRKYAASKQFRDHIGITYIAVEDPPRILGFATVAAAGIRRDEFASLRVRRLPAYPLPALRLGSLAVDRDARGPGIGSQLLPFVFALALEQSNRSGCFGVLVDAKPEAEAVDGVSTSRPEPLPMFISLAAVRTASP